MVSSPINFAASSALIHFPSEIAPKRYPLCTSTIGCRSAADETPVQISEATKTTKIVSSVGLQDLWVSGYCRSFFSGVLPGRERKIGILRRCSAFPRRMALDLAKERFAKILQLLFAYAGNATELDRIRRVFSRHFPERYIGEDDVSGPAAFICELARTRASAQTILRRIRSRLA